MSDDRLSVLLAKRSSVNLNQSMKLTEAAKRLAVDVQTVRRWIRKGALRAFKLPGGHYRVTEGAIRECQGNTP